MHRAVGFCLPMWMNTTLFTRRRALAAGVTALLVLGAQPVTAQTRQSPAQPAPPAAAPPAITQDGEPTAAGLWQQVDERGQSQGWFLIGERNGVYEGKIAKMFSQPGDPPNPTCDQCEGEQRGAPWLGLTIITGMKRSGLKYEGGRILDPRNGSVYRALMRISPDGQTLTVRGYLGVSLLGRDQTWVRLPETAYAELDPSVYPRQDAAAPPTPQRRSRTQGGAPQRSQQPYPR